MNVYKTFFKILWKQKGQIIMYLCIFAVITNLVSSQSVKDNNFEQQKFDVTFFDYDESEASKSIVSYMESVNNVKSILNDDTETIQDELYNRNIDCAITIPKGFEEALSKGNADGMLKVSGIDNTIKYDTVKSQLNAYVDTLATYLSTDYDVNKAIELSNETVSKEIKVSMLDDSESVGYSKMFYAFIYVAYVFITIMMVAIGPILIVFKKKKVRDRISCSSYSLLKTDTEIFLGMLTVGVGICVLFSILSMSIIGTDLFTFRGGLSVINMFCFAVVALAITFVAGQFVKSINALSMISNIVGLGCSFLCGVFVPLAYLSDGVKNVAKFLPAYWYVIATETIDKYSSGDSVGKIFGYMGIQILYAFALVVIGILINNKLRKTAVNA